MSVLPRNKKQKIVKNWRKDPHAIEKFQFIHHFIPHNHHKVRALLLSPKALISYTLLILLIFGVLKLVPFVAPGVLGYASNITVTDLYAYTNQTRAEYGASKLTLNEQLSEAAYQKALDMFEDDYWAHTAPDGTEPWEFILASGYDYSYAGENLARNFHYSKEVVEAWYNSPAHKENLLSKDYNEVGFAVVNGVLDGYETTLVVQMFGKSRQPTLLASADEEARLLETLDAETSARIEVAAAPSQGVAAVLPSVDVTSATKSVNLVFGGFLVGLLGLDIWYSKRKGIAKVTGHTVAHLLFLIMVIAGMWFAFVPGRIL